MIVNAVRMVFLAAVPNLNIEAQMFFYGSALFLLFCTVLAFSFVNEYESDEECRKFKQSHTIRQRWDETVFVYQRNWKDAWSVALTYAVQFTFFPGVMLEYQFSFIPNFSWFVIVVVTYASVGDTIGRWLAGKKDLISKPSLLGVCIVRGAFFTVAYMLTFEGIWPRFFGSQVFVIVMLGLFSLSCGYLATIAMKYGSDSSTVH